MLDEIRKSYVDKASFIPCWNTLSSNELADKALSKDPLKESYLAALICKHWSKINLCKQCGGKHTAISDEVCYNWLIDAILRTLQYKSWQDPKNKLYNDSKAVDKMINQSLKSIRAGYYQDNSRNKRKLNNESLDWDFSQVTESNEQLLNVHSYSPRRPFCEDLIQNKFDTNQYIQALILDDICNQQSFDKGKFSKKEARSNLKNLNKNYLTFVSNQYNVKENELEVVFKKLSKFSNKQFDYWIAKTLNSVSRSSQTIEMLRCY